MRIKIFFIQHPVLFTEYCESCEGSQGLINRDSILNMVSKSVGFLTVEFGDFGSRKEKLISVAEVFFI